MTATIFSHRSASGVSVTISFQIGDVIDSPVGHCANKH
jgi:hypothetical protein